MKTLTRLMIPLSLALAAGCSDASDSRDVVAPELGKSDSLRSVQQQETLAFGTAAENSFDQDVTFHGYRFSSLEGGVASIEVTQLGSSRGLDTTLFVYGSRPGLGWERIAFDDDSGWGALSRVRGLELGEYGQYMIVVGTADGLGRGNYRLALECDNDACVNDTPVDIDSCSDDVYELFEYCVDTELENADFGWDDPADEWSIDYCVNDGGALEMREYECDPAAANPAPYCLMSADQIEAVSGDCESRLKEAYYIVDSVSLTELSLPSSLEELQSTLYYSDTDYGSTRLDGYSYPAGASADEVFAAIRGENPRASALTVQNPQSRDDYRERQYLPDDVLDAIEAEYGTQYVAVKMHGSYYVAAGAEEWTTIHAVVYLDANVAFAVTEVAGE